MISQKEFDDVMADLAAAETDVEQLRTVLEAVLKGVQWDEKPGHINGLKTMIHRALEQTK